MGPKHFGKLTGNGSILSSKGTPSIHQQFLELDDVVGIQTWRQIIPSLPIFRSYLSDRAGIFLWLQGQMIRC